MTGSDEERKVIGRVDAHFSEWERIEMRQLGILDDGGNILAVPPARPQVPRKAITSLDILNEAYDYELPSSFTRGLSVTIKSGESRLMRLDAPASVAGPSSRRASSPSCRRQKRCPGRRSPAR